MNLSEGFRPEIISYIRNIAWPPSNAGIGNKFKTPNIIERKAVVLQNDCQSQEDGNIFPMAIKPQSPLYYPVLGLKIATNCSK